MLYTIIVVYEDRIIKVYFKNIGFLRFLLCLGIVFRHIHNAIIGKIEFANIDLYKNIIANMLQFLPVDCFFIMSGFFLFLCTNFASNMYDFMKKKIIRLLPVVIFTTLLFAITVGIIQHSITIPMKDFWVLLMLQNIGITKEYATLDNIWYVSVLFWVSCLYFYLYKIADKKVFNLLMVLTAIFGYVFYINVSIGKSPMHTDYIFNYGVIRGLAGMALGYIIYQLYEDNKIMNPVNKNSVFSKLLYTILECNLFLFIFVNILYKNMDYNNPLIIIATFAILFMLFIRKNGYISILLENNFSKFIGQYTYSIFVTHIVITKLWILYIFPYNKELVLNYPLQNIVMIFVLVFALGILTYHFVEKPITKLLTK